MSSSTVKPVLVTDATAPVRPSREQALEAVRTLIAWAGDNPDRPGLVDTPKRVVEAYGEWFDGYEADAAKELSRTFEDVIESHCEHHLAPFLGKAWVAYIPGEKVVGISKLARVVEIFARRLQNQETLTNDIIEAIETHLAPKGVAVMVDAAHQCMTTRGVHHRHVTTVTTRFTGAFKEDNALVERFLKLARA